MKQKLILILKGLIIGAGKIIPGVSGGMLAIILNVYDKGIDAISNFFKDVKNNFTFLFTLAIGIIISILSISKIIKYTLTFYYLPTMLLFIGLILGGVPHIIAEAKKEKSLKNAFVLLLGFLLILGVSIFSNKGGNLSITEVKFVPMIFIGVVDAITMIIPGISGTAILMMLGYYDVVITSFSTVTDLSLLGTNLRIIIPFGIGLVLGTIILSKAINYLLNRYKISSYYAIIGFTFASILLLLGETLSNNYNIGELLISFLFLVIGYFVGNKLEMLD